MIEISRSCSIAIGHASMRPDYLRECQFVCFLLFRIAGQGREEKIFSCAGLNPVFCDDAHRREDAFAATASKGAR